MSRPNWPGRFSTRRFPRVSGDEPIIETGGSWVTAFPRVSGDEPPPRRRHSLLGFPRVSGDAPQDQTSNTFDMLFFPRGRG